MGKKWWGKKIANIFCPIIFAPKLLTSEKRHGRCARPDFLAWLCCGPLKKKPELSLFGPACKTETMPAPAAGR
jgi:hypothetical protein